MKARRAWWELQEGSKQYIEEKHRKWQLLKLDNFSLALEILKLPRGFTCWHFKKNMSAEDRLHLCIVASLAMRNGHFEYNLLEVEHVLLRRA